MTRGARGRAVVALALATATALASGHGDTPLGAMDPAVDPADLYLFRAPATDPAADGTVTIAATFWPFATPSAAPAAPRFADEARYEIKIDIDGDAREDITYQLEFETQSPGGDEDVLYADGPIATLTDEHLHLRQIAKVTRVEKGGKKTDQREIPVAPACLGAANFPARPPLSSEQVYESIAGKAITELTVKGGGRIFLGPRDDPFFADLGALRDPWAVRTKGADSLAGFNVQAIVLQLPPAALALEDAKPGTRSKRSIIGVWVATSRPRSVTRRPGKGPRGSGWQQVGRMGLPLVASLLIPTRSRDAYAATNPRDDAHALGRFLKDPQLTRMIARRGFAGPTPPRTDLIGLISFNAGAPPLDVSGLTPADILRLDLAVPLARADHEEPLGMLAGDTAGFPNGRRLGDDVVDIVERLAAGALCAKDRTCDISATSFPLGDGVPQNDRPWLKTFPYLAPPTAPRAAPGVPK